MTVTKRQMAVAIVGLGAVGRTVARAIDEGLTGYSLAAVSVRDPERHAEFVGSLRHRPAFVAAGEAAEHADLVVECAPAAIFAELATPVVEAGKDLVLLSSGALLDHWELVDRAAQTGATIRVPSGALLGLDAVQAAAVGQIHSVRMTTRKPVTGLLGAPYLAEHGIDLDDVTAPVRVFAGSAGDGGRGFPANVNVAVALALAGIGPDRTELEIWADPRLERNTHHIEVDSDAASFSFSIENIPTDNAKTGRITAQSVIALLRKIAGPLQIGT